MANSNPALDMSASGIEELVPGLTFRWIFDRRAVALSAENSSRELVDAWADKLTEIARLWPVNRNLYVLNDFSGKDCVSTPYNQWKTRELMRMFPQRKIFTALVMKQNLTMQLSRLFIRAVPGNKHAYLCFNHDEALAWLKNHIDHDADAQL